MTTQSQTTLVLLIDYAKIILKLTTSGRERSSIGISKPVSSDCEPIKSTSCNSMAATRDRFRTRA